MYYPNEVVDLYKINYINFLLNDLEIKSEEKPYFNDLMNYIEGLSGKEKREHRLGSAFYYSIGRSTRSLVLNEEATCRRDLLDISSVCESEPLKVDEFICIFEKKLVELGFIKESDFIATYGMGYSTYSDIPDFELVMEKEFGKLATDLQN